MGRRNKEGRHARASQLSGGAVAIIAVMSLLAVGAPSAHALDVIDIDVQIEGTSIGVDIGVPIDDLACDTLQCFAVETTHLGPNGPEVRLHTGLTPNLDGLSQWAIDVDAAEGWAEPQPMVLFALNPDHDLAVSVTRNAGALPAEDDFTLRIERTLFAAAAPLPVRVELVSGDLADPSASNTTLGYDALASSAPLAFEMRVELDESESRIDDWVQTESTTSLDMSVTVPSTSLAIITETFDGMAGEGPHGPLVIRPDARSSTVASFRGSSLPLDTSVPSRIGASVFERTDPEATGTATSGATQPPGFGTPLMDIDLAHNGTGVALDVTLGEPDGSATTATIDELPATVGLAVADEDVDDDGQPDTKLTYEASSVVRTVEISRDDGEGKVVSAVVEDMPDWVQLTYAKPDIAPVVTETSRETRDDVDITLNASGRATRATLGISEDNRVAEVVVTRVPANIHELRYQDVETDIDDPAAGQTSRRSREFSYRADGGADSVEVTFSDRDRAIEAIIEGVPTEVHSLRFDDEDFERRTIGVLDDPENSREAGSGEFHETIDVVYDTDVPTGSLTVDAFGLGDQRDTHLHLLLREIPTFVRFASSESGRHTSEFTGNGLQTGGTCDPVNETCLPPEDCIPEDRPLECDHDAIDETRMSNSEIRLETAPDERLALAELQLTTGPDERLPGTTNGLLVRDLEADDVVFARLDGLQELVVIAAAASLVRTGLPVLTHLPETRERDTSSHVGLRTQNVDPATPKPEVTIDSATWSPTEVAGTEAHLPFLPDDVAIDTTASFDHLHLDNGSTLEYRASETVPGTFAMTSFTIDLATGEGEVDQRMTLTPLPREFTICQHEEAACTRDIFGPGINRIVAGEPNADHGCAPRCREGIPISESLASNGSLRITSVPETHLVVEAPGEQRLDLNSLTTFALQADSLSDYGCLQGISTCDRGYFAIDTDGDAISGEISVEPAPGADNGSAFVFPEGWWASQRIVAFVQSDVHAEVALDGSINCPNGTVLDAEGEDLVEFFCSNDLDELVWTEFVSELLIFLVKVGLVFPIVLELIF